MEANFDANHRIAGFSLTSIKRAILHVGLMDDRDDIDTVAQYLNCGRRQAERVLEELEREQLVTRTSNPRQWKTTERGHALGFYWQPPRRFQPVIERESRGGLNEMFGEAPCLILRSAAEQEDLFEEAFIEAGVFVEYEGDHLVEVSLIQPNDYEEPAGGARIDTSIYLTPAAAKTLAESLRKSIEGAEREVARRQRIDARRLQRGEERRKAGKKPRKNAAGRVFEIAAPPRKPRGAPPKPFIEAPAAAVAPVTDEVESRKRRDAIAASLKELRETNRMRREASR